VRYGSLKITWCIEDNIKIGKQGAHGIVATYGQCHMGQFQIEMVD
jgi:hypothetical protein